MDIRAYMREEGMTEKSLSVFVSYAHEDDRLHRKLDTHLSQLKWQGCINVWHDRNISAGTEWEREIDEHLNTAQFILLLISPDFMASKYCYSIEMKRAMQRHDRGEAHVIPIIVRPVLLGEAPFSKLQMLPTEAKPATAWPGEYGLDDAFADVARGILKVIEEWKEQQQVGEVSPIHKTLEPPVKEKGHLLQSEEMSEEQSGEMIVQSSKMTINTPSEQQNSEDQDDELPEVAWDTTEPEYLEPQQDIELNGDGFFEGRASIPLPRAGRSNRNLSYSSEPSTPSTRLARQRSITTKKILKECFRSVKSYARALGAQGEVIPPLHGVPTFSPPKSLDEQSIIIQKLFIFRESFSSTRMIRYGEPQERRGGRYDFIHNRLKTKSHVVWLCTFCLLSGMSSASGVLTQSWLWAVVTLAITALLTYALGYRKVVSSFTMFVITAASGAITFWPTIEVSSLNYEQPHLNNLWLTGVSTLWYGRQMDFGLTIGTITSVLCFFLYFKNGSRRLDDGLSGAMIGLIVGFIVWLTFASISLTLHWGYGFGTGWEISLLGAVIGIVAGAGLAALFIVWAVPLHEQRRSYNYRRSLQD